MLFIFAQQKVPVAHVDSHSGHRPEQSPLHAIEPQHTVASPGVELGQPPSIADRASAAPIPWPSTLASSGANVSTGTPLQPPRSSQAPINRKPDATPILVIGRSRSREAPTRPRRPAARPRRRVGLERRARTARDRRPDPSWQRLRLQIRPPGAPRRARGCVSIRERLHWPQVDKRCPGTRDRAWQCRLLAPRAGPRPRRPGSCRPLPGRNLQCANWALVPPLRAKRRWATASPRSRSTRSGTPALLLVTRSRFETEVRLSLLRLLRGSPVRRERDGSSRCGQPVRHQSEPPCPGGPPRARPG